VVIGGELLLGKHTYLRYIRLCNLLCFPGPLRLSFLLSRSRCVETRNESPSRANQSQPL
jgi:hypothetical protein